MKNIKILLFTLVTFGITTGFSSNALALYGKKICNDPGFFCHKVKRGETWSTLFPDDSERQLVKRLNRMNVALRAGNVIAIPHNPSNLSMMDISPFPSHSSPHPGGTIKVDQSDLAWGAYDSSGNLLRWGPTSGGQSYCPDIKRGCRTINGTFTVYRTQGAGCRSSVYPRPRGGAPMPYCMHYSGGYALHGSETVPGYNASHGCVRMFTEDARWLNQDFVQPGRTKVIVQP